MGKVVTLWSLIGLICHDPSLALNNELQSCSTSPPPCILERPVDQYVCRGEDASAEMTVELPEKMFEEINIMDVTLYRENDPFIQGFRSHPAYPDQVRWKVIHTISGTERKSGLLSVTAHVHDIQPEDVFESHIRIAVGHEVLETPQNVWFRVKDNCSVLPTDKPDGEGQLLSQIGSLHQELIESTTMITDTCMKKTDMNNMRNAINILSKKCSICYSCDESTSEATTLLHMLTGVTVLAAIIIIVIIYVAQRKMTEDIFGMFILHNSVVSQMVKNKPQRQ